MKLTKFTAGIVSGFVLGLLLAPAKGVQTRKKVKDTAEAWRSRLNQLFGKGETELDELKMILEDESEELDAEARLKLLKLIEENRRTIREAKQHTLS